MTIDEEFNTIQHDRGIVSMARSNHPDSAGSQFFIVHKDNNQLDGKYTVFGRLVPGLPNGLDKIAKLPTNDRNQPIDASQATIVKTSILDGYNSCLFWSRSKHVTCKKSKNLQVVLLRDISTLFMTLNLIFPTDGMLLKEKATILT